MQTATNPLSAIEAARYREAVIPPCVLGFLVDLARQQDLDPAPWFAGIGLTPAQCVDPEQRVSFRQAATVIRRALRSTGDSALGLRVGQRESLASCGSMGFAMMSAPTFGDALDLVPRYHQVTGSLLDLRVEVAGSRVSLIASERFPEPDLVCFFCEELFCCALQVARALLGPDCRPLWLEFAFPPPPHVALYDHVFPCPVRFDAAMNRAVFDADWLDAPLPTADSASHHSMVRMCSTQIRAVPIEDDAVSALRAWLAGRLDMPVTARDAAHALNMSERTLRRRLAEAGTGFQAVRDRLRAQQAERWLRESDAPIARIGERLGFSDAREFRRAFKRWTGQVPSAVRTTAVRPDR